MLRLRPSTSIFRPFPCRNIPHVRFITPAIPGASGKPTSNFLDKPPYYTDPADITKYTKANASNVSINTPSEEGEPVQVHLEFSEEPIGLRAADGYGYPRIDIDDVLDGRYPVVRKIARDVPFTTWLAKDSM